MTQAPDRLRLRGDRRMSGCDEDRIRIAIAQAMEHRAVIEQAKGMLSVIYDIDDQAAFDVLRWRSQTTNTKLRALARQLIADFRSVRSALNSPSTSRYDALLLTAHERVAGTASVKDA